jgi:hypothetical protein
VLISALTIENFKGIGPPALITFKPITLLFGPNSAGKSTILQALHYAREIFERQNFDPDKTLDGGESLDLGGFKSLVHKFDTSKAITLRFDLDLSDSDLPEYLAPPEKNFSESFNHLQAIGRLPEPESWDLSDKVESGWVEIKLKWSHALERVQLTDYETGFDGHPFARIKATDDGRRVRLAYLNFEHPSFPIPDPDSFEGVEDCPRSSIDLMFDIVVDEKVVPKGEDLELGLVGLKSALPRSGRPLQLLDSCLVDEGGGENHKIALELAANLSQLLVGPAEVLRDFLREIRYLGPLRETPPRNYTPLRSEDKSRWAGGLAAWDTLYKKGPGFIERVSSWFSDETRLNSGYMLKLKRIKEVDPDAPYFKSLVDGTFRDDGDDQIGELDSQPDKNRLVLIDNKRGIEVHPQDVGVGISQVLPVIVGALDETIQIFAVEQPELHIHPALQVALGDLFISEAQGGLRFFLIETHSEHLILRLMRRMRETYLQKNSTHPPVTPEDVAVLYVELDGDHSVVREMPLNERGELVKAWPGGFFEEGLREVF